MVHERALGTRVFHSKSGDPASISSLVKRIGMLGKRFHARAHDFPQVHRLRADDYPHARDHGDFRRDLREFDGSRAGGLLVRFQVQDDEWFHEQTPEWAIGRRRFRPSRFARISAGALIPVVPAGLFPARLYAGQILFKLCFAYTPAEMAESGNALEDQGDDFRCICLAALEIPPCAEQGI